ncbi:MAG TPA: hypothetical protein PKD26_07265 [Pyrinomonadaceae bacterium]|nr:hypothetical protein [Pyrinomonadaceae bacterium]
MEILIPGLILVGFMVWASTRIKRNAARAFEREEIETPEFSLTKPDGFLAVAEPAEGLLFSAYSKEFGTGAAEAVRRATAEIVTFPAASFEDAVTRAKGGSGNTIEEDFGVVNETKYVNLISEHSLNGVGLLVHTKCYFTGSSAIQLSATCISEYSAELGPKIEEMLMSFKIK